MEKEKSRFVLAGKKFDCSCGVKGLIIPPDEITYTCDCGMKFVPIYTCCMCEQIITPFEIGGEKMVNFGHNPAPFEGERCCDDCNNIVVTARFSCGLNNRIHPESIKAVIELYKKQVERSNLVKQEFEIKKIQIADLKTVDGKPAFIEQITKRTID